MRTTNRNNRGARPLWLAAGALVALSAFGYGCGGDGTTGTTGTTDTTSTSTSGSGSGGAGGTGSGTMSAVSSGAGGSGGSVENHGPPATEMVSAGDVCTSPSYRMVHTLGQPTQNQGTTTSPGYRMQGGLIGANGSLP